MAGKSGKEEAEKGEEKLDFKKISKKLANLFDEQHVNEIAQALTHEFLEHAKYTDKDGVVHFKDEFEQEDAKQLADKLYDSLGYHIHRRYLKMPEEGYKRLKEIKDPNGNPYVDMITEYHFDLKRKDLKDHFGKKKKGNEINMRMLQKLLEEPVRKHAGKIQKGLLDKKHLYDPKNMGKLKGAIDEIVKEFKLDADEINTSEMYDPGEVLRTYMDLAQTHYVKGAHAKDKDEKK